MRKTTTALLAAGLLAAALPALAQPGHGRGPGLAFEQVDADRDGRITWEEGWRFVQQRFTAADANGDGALTQDEMQAVMPWGDRGDRGGRHGEMRGAMFRAIDANRDARVTLDELRPAVEARFRAFDANLDNAVTREEMPRHAGRRGDGPGRGQPPAGQQPPG